MSRNAPQQTTPPFSKTVISSTGFDQGDLVYFKGGDYKTIDNVAVTEAPFAVTQSAPTYTQTSGSNITTVDINGGSAYNFAAKLTNGNIVQAYVDGQTTSTGIVYFQIVNQSGTVVVSQTQVSGTYLCANTGSRIGVIALSGGGFVVGFINTAGGVTGYPTYAIYDNSGAVVTSIQQDVTSGTASTTGTPLSMLALPNGNFVLAFTKVGAPLNVTVRAYSPTGTGIFAATVMSVVNYSIQKPISLAARSDSSFLIFYGQTTTLRQWYIYTGAGALVTSGSFTSTYLPTAAASYQTSATCLADGNTFVLSYSGHNTTTYMGTVYRLLPSTNVLASEQYIPYQNFFLPSNATTYYGTNTVFSLSSGGFILVCSDLSKSLYYTIFNSSGTALTPTNALGAIPQWLPGASAGADSRVTVVETTDNINLYWVTQAAVNSSYPNKQYFTQINSTTYQPVNGVSVTQTVGSAFSNVSGYTPDGSTPSGAKFLASSSTTISTTKPAGLVVPPGVISGQYIDSLDCDSFSDGSFVVVYKTYLSAEVYIAKFTESGGLTQIIFVGNGYPIGNQYNVRIATLSGGGCVVAYSSQATPGRLTITTFDENLTQVAQITPLATVLDTNSGSFDTNQFDMAGLTNDRFVIGFYSVSASIGSGLGFAVYSSTLTQLTAPTLVTSTVPNRGLSVAARPGGGFFITEQNSSNFGQGWIFDNYTGDTFTQRSTTGSYGSGNLANYQSFVEPGGLMWMAGSNGSGNVQYRVSDQNAAAYSNTTMSFSSMSAIDFMSNLGQSGNGMMAWVYMGQTATGPAAYGPSVWGFASDGTGDVDPVTYLPTNYRFALPNISLADTYPMPRTAAGAGYNIIVCFRDDQFRPNVMICSVAPITASTTLVSGTTKSAAVEVSPSTNGTLNGYVFQGVAASAASAGGTGVVQLTGEATLNSAYSASTPYSAFDFTTPNGSGVKGTKGTIVGRTVTLEENS